MQTKFPVGSKIQYQPITSDQSNVGIVCKVPVEYVEKYMGNPDGYYWAVSPDNVWAYWGNDKTPLYLNMNNYDITLVEEPAEQPEVQKQDKFEYLCVPQKGVEFPIENWLNQYGEVGWELVTTDYGKFIFKRKVQE